MHFLAEYGLYLAKTATIVIAILIILLAITASILKVKQKGKDDGKLVIKKINDELDEQGDQVRAEILDKKALKAYHKAQKQAAKKAAKENKNNLFVIHFQGDIRASGVASLREEISAIILAAQPGDEVLVCLESPGGMVHGYGLASSQLTRLKDAKLKLTIVVDKVAASGGYMMACVADRILAAPFAVIGSIGVVTQLPNFHRFLEDKKIDFEQITAGEFKRTLTVFGENTDKARLKVQEEVNDIHDLFKTFIREHRQSLNIDEVATGEHWFGTQALAKKLVDGIQTSDDFLLTNKDRFDIYEVSYKIKKPFAQKLTATASAWLNRLHII